MIRLSLLGCLTILFSIQILFPVHATSQEPEMSPQFINVSKKRISRSVYDFTFKTTLINHDQPIKNISARITSSSPYTTIMDDGIVHFNDIAANETAVSTDIFVLRQERRHRYDPDAIAWNIDFLPDIPFLDPDTSIDVDTLPQTVKIVEGETRDIKHTLNFSSSSKNTPFNILITQTLTPPVAANLTPVINNTTLVFDHGQYKDIVQRFPVLPIGEYKVSTTATIVETGESITSVTQVTVKSPNDPLLHVNMVSLSTQALAVDSVTMLDTAVSINGKDMEEVTEVKLTSLNSDYTTTLSRTGVQRYRGSLAVDTHGMQPRECLEFIAEATTIKGTVTSKEPSILCVTSFPFDPPLYPEVWSDTVVENTHFMLNKFWALFNDGVSEPRIRELVAQIGGEVVRVMIGKRWTYIIGLDPHPDSIPELLDIMQQFQNLPEVKQVEMSFGVPVSSMETNDPVADLQSWIPIIRADEAWYVTQGDSAKTIVIIDSGIDAGHVDLQNKMLAGRKDFVNETEPSHSHGTHVAGIAAAETNNGQGVAGVAWQNPVFDIKIANHDGITSPERMVDGINYSFAPGSEDPIVNFSVGFQETQNWFCKMLELTIGTGSEYCFTQAEIDHAKSEVCDAVELAVKNGIFFVAAAGNAGSCDRAVPAACSGALVVGATDNDDQRFVVLVDPIEVDFVGGSNYGSWVHLAAPGKDIWSTMPGGNYDTKSGTSQAAPMVTGES